MNLRVKFKETHPQNRSIYVFTTENGEDVYLDFGEGSSVENLTRDFMDKYFHCTRILVETEGRPNGERYITNIVSYK